MFHPLGVSQLNCSGMEAFGVAADKEKVFPGFLPLNSPRVSVYPGLPGSGLRWIDYLYIGSASLLMGTSKYG